MLKDFQESLCQSREHLSTLRAFLLFFPLVVKASHWVPQQGTLCPASCLQVLPLTQAISRDMHAAGVTRDAWGVTKVPALCNTRQISSPIPHGMTLHSNRQPGIQKPQRPSQNCTELHLIFIYNFF